MQLKDYIESFSQTETLPTRERIEKGRTKLFDFTYPIFDEKYRKEFETKMIRNFYMREIGFETEGLFKFNLETWLLVNMPYYNKLFESELLEYDPLTNSKMNSTHKTTKNVNQNKNQSDNRDIIDSNTSSTINDSTDTRTINEDGTVTDDNFDRRIDSDTPDNRLALTATDGEGVINYASNISENNENNKQTNSKDSTDKDVLHATGSLNADGTRNDKLTSDVNESLNETEDYVQDRLGKIGVQTFPKLVQEYRDALMRIERQIYVDMQQLFMGVY